MMQKKYCGNRPAKLRFIVIDFFVDNFLRIIGSKKNQVFVNPQRILLFNFGHLGDMLMMGYMVNVFRIKYPNVEIHLVAGRWCKILIENNPLYDKIYYFDHFQNNRQSISFIKKYFTHFEDILSIIKTLKNVKFSHSFDFRYSAYTANQLLPFLCIEQKNGFGTRGLGGVLDNVYFLLPDGSHSLDIQGQVFKSVDIQIDRGKIQPIIPNNFIKIPTPQLDSNYLMLFPETGNPERMFPLDFWHKIISIILDKYSDYQLVICGVTDFNSQLAETLHAKIPNKIIKATKRFSIPQIVNLLEKAKGAVTLDSFPAHLSSVKTNTLSLFKNASGNEYFPINSFPLHIIHDNLIAQKAESFREKMKVSYVETFESPKFEENFKMAIETLF
jgi:heptosyltransferase III